LFVVPELFGTRLEWLLLMDGSAHAQSTKLQYTPEKILRGTKRTRTVELQGRKSRESFHACFLVLKFTCSQSHVRIFNMSAENRQKRRYIITTAAADGLNIGTGECRHKFPITTAVADVYYILPVVSGINTDSCQRHKY
jgi:hypothetical protein